MRSVPVAAAQHGAQQIASSGWFDRLARLGFAAKGMVYVLIGLLALRLAVGAGGETTSTTGIFGRVLHMPLGELLLALIGIGMFGYAAWRFAQSALDTSHAGSDTRGAGKRVGYAVSGLIHGGLGLSAFRLLAGDGSSQGDPTKSWTARLMSQPAGELLVAAAGLGLIGLGVYQLLKARRRKFLEDMQLGGISSTERNWLERFGQWGYSARGVVFALMGLFLVLAGLRSNAAEARGLEGVLDAVAGQSYGPWLLALVSVGLMAYGGFLLFAAKYRQVNG